MPTTTTPSDTICEYSECRKPLVPGTNKNRSRYPKRFCNDNCRASAYVEKNTGLTPDEADLIKRYRKEKKSTHANNVNTNTN